MFDLGRRDPRKQLRFRRPEFQNKLRRARAYERQSEPLPETFWTMVLHSVGFRSALGRWAGLFFLLLLAYFVFVSDVFLVRNAMVDSGEISSSQVEDALSVMSRQRSFLIPRTHLLVFRRAGLLSRMQAIYPQIRQVSLFKIRFPDTVKLAFEIREKRFIWATGGEYLFLDQDGVAFESLATYDPDVNRETLITDESAAALALGQAVQSPRLIVFAEQVRKLWPEQVRGAGLASFSIPALKSPDVFVKTDLGFSVYLDLERSVQVQLANLNYLLSGQIKPETYGGLSYIDLRLPAQAYYCYKDAPCAPEYATSTQPIINK